MGSRNSRLRFYASGYSGTADDPGIFAFEFDPETNAVEQVDACAGVPNPSYVEVCGRDVYAASESKGFGRIAAYRIGDDGVLAYCDAHEYPGEEETCYVLRSPDGKCLYGADYASGSICSCALEPDGSLGEPFPLVKHEGHGFGRPDDDPNAGRQDTPHVHTLSYVPGTDYLAAVDLGLDSIYIYETDDDGQIDPEPVAVIKAPEGTGPRIVAYHPTLPLAAVICELACEVLIYEIGEDGLAWELVDRMDLLEEAGSRRLSTAPPLSAHAEFSPDGRFLYTSTRGVDLITTFEMDESGRPVSRIDQPSGGRSPRHFVLSPDGAYIGVANQLDDAVSIFERDSETGRLSKVAEAACTQPSCVAWVADDSD